MTAVWLIISYLASIALCSWLYNKMNRYCGEKWKEQFLNIFNVDKIMWIVCWIPIYNLYWCYICISQIYTQYKHLHSPISTKYVKEKKQKK